MYKYILQSSLHQLRGRRYLFDNPKNDIYYINKSTIKHKGFFTKSEEFNDPTDPSTYKLPYKDFEIIDTQIIEDLPVWKYGCDSLSKIC